MTKLKIVEKPNRFVCLGTPSTLWHPCVGRYGRLGSDVSVFGCFLHIWAGGRCGEFLGPQALKFEVLKYFLLLRSCVLERLGTKDVDAWAPHYPQRASLSASCSSECGPGDGQVVVFFSVVFLMR